MNQQDIDRMAELAHKFYEEVLPQSGQLVFQNYSNINELGELLGQYKREIESNWPPTDLKIHKNAAKHHE